MLLKIDSVTEQTKAGTRCPFLVTCNDQKQYIMKCRNNEPSSDKYLFNELIGSRIATLLELPAPNTSLARLSQRTISNNRSLDDLHFIPGTVFVSEYLNGSPGMNPIIFNAATNSDDFGGILFFDQLVMNTDRGENPGNWFYDRKLRKLCIIDNSNIFRLASIWNAVSLSQDMRIPPCTLDQLDQSGYKMIRQIIQTKVEYPFDKIRRLAKQITVEQITEAFTDIPTDWRISMAEQTAAFDFICYQFKHTDDIIAALNVYVRKEAN
ncbi:hypothetical protein A8704_01440 [Lactiplantibacillus plantarum]|nr:hypothetical protein A8704_01440 [Lactiplantibacillus plantarum]